MLIKGNDRAILLGTKREREIMGILIVLIIVVIVGGIVLLVMKAAMEPRIHAAGRDGNIPIKAKPLLSNAELNFYHVMRAIIPNDREITCKCRIEDFITIENCPGKVTYRNRIKSRHVDFVIFNMSNGKIDYAIELDDRSHHSEKARETDQLKDEIFEKINIPLVRIPAKRIYDPKEIQKILNKVTSSSADRGLA